jgi:hypothetical protein
LGTLTRTTAGTRARTRTAPRVSPLRALWRTTAGTTATARTLTFATIIVIAYGRAGAGGLVAGDDLTVQGALDQALDVAQKRHLFVADQ